VTNGPGQPRPSGAVEWRAEPPDGAWERVVAEAPREQRTYLIVAGSVSVVAGLVAALVPAVASVGMAVFIGIVLLLASVAIAVDAFSAPGLGRKLMRVLAAVLTFAAGLYLLVSPLEGTYTLTVMLVLWFLGVGVARIATGMSELGTPGAAWTISAGAASLLLGILIARELPSAADWAIGLLVGIDLIIYGALCLARAFRLPMEVHSR
jgi:uncharacterized membrane protein HdeD (DUF308 family)